MLVELHVTVSNLDISNDDLLKEVIDADNMVDMLNTLRTYDKIEEDKGKVAGITLNASVSDNETYNYKVVAYDGESGDLNLYEEHNTHYTIGDNVEVNHTGNVKSILNNEVKQVDLRYLESDTIYVREALKSVDTTIELLTNCMSADNKKVNVSKHGTLMSFVKITTEV